MTTPLPVLYTFQPQLCRVESVKRHKPFPSLVYTSSWPFQHAISINYKIIDWSDAEYYFIQHLALPHIYQFNSVELECSSTRWCFVLLAQNLDSQIGFEKNRNENNGL